MWGVSFVSRSRRPLNLNLPGLTQDPFVVKISGWHSLGRLTVCEGQVVTNTNSILDPTSNYIIIWLVEKLGNGFLLMVLNTLPWTMMLQVKLDDNVWYGWRALGNSFQVMIFSRNISFIIWTLHREFPCFQGYMYVSQSVSPVLHTFCAVLWNGSWQCGRAQHPVIKVMFLHTP